MNLIFAVKTAEASWWSETVCCNSGSLIGNGDGRAGQGPIGDGRAGQGPIGDGGSNWTGGRMNEGRYLVDQGSSASSRAVADMFARDLNANPNQMCSGCRASVSSNSNGTMNVNITRQGTDGDGDGSYNPTPTPTRPTCTQTSDIRVVGILFVRAGTYTGTARPATALLVDQANLQAGVAYQPIVQIRNLNCNSTSAFNSASTPKLALSIETLLAAVTPNQALANGGGGGSPTPVTTLSGFHINQLPFGTAGGFPVRLQIDYGQNGSFEYTQFLNNRGPIRGIPPPNSTQTPTNNLFIAFPAFTATQSGTHSITANADVTNTQEAGRGCTSMVAAPAPAVSPIDWGCINELNPAGARSEANNNLTETFTIARAQVLLVSVADVTVRVGGNLNTVPFTVQNQSTLTLPEYTYIIRINGSGAGLGTRTLTLPPNQTDSVLGAVSYSVPSSATTVPLEVCATSALLATTSCATARVIVTSTECSDTTDNDGDGTSDATDNGCWTNPSDPTTYNPNDNSEGGIIDLTPPTLRIWSDSPIVRFNGQATISYSISAPYAITCTVTGGGINQTVNHVSGTTNGSELSNALQSKQRFTLSCPGFDTGATRVIDSSQTFDLEVIPQVQEV